MERINKLSLAKNLERKPGQILLLGNQKVKGNLKGGRPSISSEQKTKGNSEGGQKLEKKGAEKLTVDEGED